MFRVTVPLAMLLAAAIASATCPDLGTAPHSRWATRRSGPVAWLETPCGDPFFSIGMNTINPGTFDLESWLPETRARLLGWGFNTVGSTSSMWKELRLPFTPNLELGRTAQFHWFDPFAPGTEQRMLATARELVAPYRGNPLRIGYFSDNEVGWWSGALFTFFARKPASNHTKQRLVALLRSHYADDWPAFVRDWVPADGVDSFDALLTATQGPRLRPGGRGIAVVRVWTGLIADHYYRLITRTLRAADPEALVLGDRLPIYYDPVAVRAMAPYVDVIATNYNVDSPDGWIAPYFFEGLERLSAGVPVLVTEWFFAATENRTGNRNNGHLMTVGTQAERARGAAAAARLLAEQPNVVGLHWFQYYDHPRGGRVSDGEDYNFGLVDIDGRPYDETTRALAAANAQLPAIHAHGAPREPRPFQLPCAAIDATDRSLADWPHDEALVPRLLAAPGEVPFGNVSLAWNPTGIALALDAMDYYDPQLLAFDDVFPREEAFTLLWGIDAGHGAKRFVLRVIPPKVFPQHSAPMMRAELCQVVGEGCREVPGAITTYFGADQPRITVEILIPWSAVGSRRTRPPIIHTEVAATAWHRSRWMSWSGREPSLALSDSRGWRAVPLASRASPCHRRPESPAL